MSMAAFSLIHRPLHSLFSPASAAAVTTLRAPKHYRLVTCRSHLLPTHDEQEEEKKRKMSSAAAQEEEEEVEERKRSWWRQLGRRFQDQANYQIRPKEEGEMKKGEGESKEGDWKDLVLMSLSFAVYVYISQKLVCAYCSWISIINSQHHF